MAHRNDFLRSPSTSTRRGVLDPRMVRLASFAVSAVGLLFATVLTILAIWDRAPRDAAWRAVATLGVLVASALLFNLVNEFFGARLAELATPNSPPPPRGLDAPPGEPQPIQL